MNIGFVSTWLPRGAAYVTINYIKLVQPEYNAFVYARGGEYFDPNFEFNSVPVHKGLRLEGTKIDVKDIVKWIRKNNLDIVIFNEQESIESVCHVKELCNEVIFGSYIDYYKESTIKDFKIYDFLICNTKRHLSVFSWHPQCLYLPWGTDIDLYSPSREKRRKGGVRFFHSMGMSNRKGTDVLIDSFVSRELYKLGAKLVIHTQKKIDHLITEEKAKQVGIEIICKSVPAPGLYHLGDIYVYPAKLDGLGLTMYEALACGLPVIATDVAPMNEVVNSQNGKLVKVKKMFSRSDGYYWPLAVVDEDSLTEAMLYYINNVENLERLSKNAREYAVANLNLRDRKNSLLDFLQTVKRIDTSDFSSKKKAQFIKEKKLLRNHLIVALLPVKIEAYIRNHIEQNRKNRV